MSTARASTPEISTPKMSNVDLAKLMSTYQNVNCAKINVNLPKCQLAKMSNYQNVNWAYGKAGIGNEMETGNGNWKLETENRNGNATS